MLGPIDWALWIICFVLEVGVLASTFYRKAFLRYLPLNIFMMCNALTDCGQYICMHKFGYNSYQYYYFYYYTCSLLAILLFTVIIQFYLRVFKELEVSQYVRRVAFALLIFTALFSYIVVHKNRDHFTKQFVVEFSQNIYFVEVVLTYLLWGALLKVRETQARVVQLILALGIYFSATAGTYALRNLFPSLQDPILRFFPPLIGIWLPLAWCYTFLRVPEESRLETNQLLTPTPALAVKTQ